MYRVDRPRQIITMKEQHRNARDSSGWQLIPGIYEQYVPFMKIQDGRTLPSSAKFQLSSLVPPLVIIL